MMGDNSRGVNYILMIIYYSHTDKLHPHKMNELPIHNLLKNEVFVRGLIIMFITIIYIILKKLYDGTPMTHHSFRRSAERSYRPGRWPTVPMVWQCPQCQR